MSRANGTSTSYSYDPVSRLSQLVQDPAGTTHDLERIAEYKASTS